MATFTRERVRAVTRSGGPPEIRYFPESASRTHKAGCVMYLSASSRVIPGGVGIITNSADIGTPSTSSRGGIVGFALADGGNYTNSTTMVPVLVANSDTLFITNLVSRTSTATATASYALVGSILAASCNASRFYLSTTLKAATCSIGYVAGFHPQTAVGDTYGLVYFKFLTAALSIVTGVRK